MDEEKKQNPSTWKKILGFEDIFSVKVSMFLSSILILYNMFGQTLHVYSA